MWSGQTQCQAALDTFRLPHVLCVTSWALQVDQSPQVADAPIWGLRSCGWARGLQSGWVFQGPAWATIMGGARTGRTAALPAPWTVWRGGDPAGLGGTVATGKALASGELQLSGELGSWFTWTPASSFRAVVTS